MYKISASLLSNTIKSDRVITAISFSQRITTYVEPLISSLTTQTRISTPPSAFTQFPSLHTGDFTRLTRMPSVITASQRARKLRVVETTATSLKLDWGAPKGSHVGYVVRLIHDGTSTGTEEVELHRKETSHKFNGLNPGTLYAVQVAVRARTIGTFVCVNASTGTYYREYTHIHIRASARMFTQHSLAHTPTPLTRTRARTHARAHAVIIPVFEYACLVWHTNLNRHLTGSIEIVQNMALKCIYPVNEYADIL